MKTADDFIKHKQTGIPISMATCYDYWSAVIINETNVDAILVGDSAAMVMHGFETTLNAEMEMMLYHVSSVRRGLKDKLLIADFPFMAHRKGNEYAIECTDRFMKTGAQAVKIEGAADNLPLIKHIVNSGVPVMGHIGLTPQSVNIFGGYKIQGKSEEAAAHLLSDAKALEDAGCFSIVLELVPAEVAKNITEQISIPTIGIGAGKFTSGQILVLQDLLGLTKAFHPKFLRKYLDGFEVIKSAINRYDADVKKKLFPNNEESY
ncbi:MAG: 3-methyl-2-oxobutanoate hydroxymethyltransferase [bacterium]